MDYITPPAIVRPLASRRCTVLDVRRDEEFNGWRLHGEARGGHIPGAIQFPVEWMAGEGLKGKLEQRGVHPEDRIVIAATGATRGRDAYDALRRAGFPYVALLQGGLEAWLADDRWPVERLPGYRMLVPPAWLDDVMRGKRPVEPPAGPVTVLEVGWGGPEKTYDRGHIPGALHLDTNDIEADTAVSPRGYWRLLSPERLRATLAKLGITHEATVVVYSKPNFAAARALWALMYAGVRDVRLLNGGLAAWQREGLAVETLSRAVPAPRPFGVEIPQRPELRRDTAWVREHLNDKAQTLADMRSWPEFTGKISGYDDVTGKGRIPGARWVKGGADPHTLTGDYEDEDGTLRSYTEVRAMWQTLGIPEDRPMTFYCGTGWRASLGFMYALMMDRPVPAVYDSGWMDWCMGPYAPINPIVTGP